jgi:hypothetical protein
MYKRQKINCVSVFRVFKIFCCFQPYIQRQIILISESLNRLVCKINKKTALECMYITKCDYVITPYHFDTDTKWVGWLTVVNKGR